MMPANDHPPFQSESESYSGMASQIANESDDDWLSGQHDWDVVRESDYSTAQSIPNYDGCEDGEMVLEYSKSMNHPHELWEYLQNCGPPVTAPGTLQPPITFTEYQTFSNADLNGIVHAPIAFRGSWMSPGSNSILLHPDHDKNTSVLQHAHGGQPTPPLDTVESHAYRAYPQNSMFALPVFDPVHYPETSAQHDIGHVVPPAWSSDHPQLDLLALSITAPGPPPPLPVEQPQHESQEDDNESEPESPHKRNWKMIPLNALVVTGTKYFVPQVMYRPVTRTDQSRYVEEINFRRPIIFYVDNPHEWGIPLEDTRNKTRKNMTRLQGKDDLMLEGCGPSASIRIQWKGYGSWSRQISTQNYRKPKGPITRAKLVEHVADCVSRFINEMQNKRMEDDGDKRFRVGHGHIVTEDLILVSLHHISKGSWQPQLRLKRLPWKQA